MKFAEIWLTGLTWFLWILFAMFLISNMWGWAALYFVIASVACNIDPKSEGKAETTAEEAKKFFPLELH